jgi:hypothetical protein
MMIKAKAEGFLVGTFRSHERYLCENFWLPAKAALPLARLQM